LCCDCGGVQEDPLSWRCGCGGPYRVELEGQFDRKLLCEWRGTRRYIHRFPYLRTDLLLDLGEGGTPLVRLQNGAFLKLESLEPTGSFKDRGSVAMISKIREHCKPGSLMVEDSSGNAGASVAAYSAAAGFRCEIYTPEQVQKVKATQIQAYGAELIKVKGGRDRIEDAAIKAAENGVYASHIWNPFFRDGIKTLSYEIFEQLGCTAPDFVVMPASAGTLLLGVIAGFRDLKSSGLIKSEPVFVVAQPEKISPIHSRLHNVPYKPRLPKRIVTDALISTRPALMNQIIKELTSGQWLSGTVTDRGAEHGQRDLAHRGFYAEPSSAIAWTLYQDMRRSGSIPADSSTVVIASGNGLKTTVL